MPESTGTVVHTFNPSTQEAEVGRPQEFEANLGYTHKTALQNTINARMGIKELYFAYLSRCGLDFTY